jgi:gp16 family phage-associated protein
MDAKKAIKERFEAHGEVIAEWARNNGYKPRTVYAVLSGQLKAKRGLSHKIAVALGIKAMPGQAKHRAKAA